MSQIINRILPTKKIKEGLKWTNIKLQNQLHFSISKQLLQIFTSVGTKEFSRYKAVLCRLCSY